MASEPMFVAGLDTRTPAGRAAVDLCVAINEARAAASSMPDAGLVEGDPRFEWYSNVLSPAMVNLTVAWLMFQGQDCRLRDNPHVS